MVASVDWYKVGYQLPTTHFLNEKNKKYAKKEKPVNICFQVLYYDI